MARILLSLLVAATAVGLAAQTPRQTADDSGPADLVLLNGRI